MCAVFPESEQAWEVLHQQCTEVEECSSPPYVKRFCHSPRRKLICRYFENRKDTSKEDNDFLAAMKILEMAWCLFLRANVW